MIGLLVRKIIGEPDTHQLQPLGSGPLGRVHILGIVVVDHIQIKRKVDILRDLGREHVRPEDVYILRFLFVVREKIESCFKCKGLPEFFVVVDRSKSAEFVFGFF